jgi:hypothetical protein
VAGAPAVVVVDGDWDRDSGTAIAERAAGFHIERIDIVRSLAPSSIGRAWDRIRRRAAMTDSPRTWWWTGIRLAVLAAAMLPLNLLRLMFARSSAPATTVVVTLRDAAMAGGTRRRQRV